MDEQYTQCDNVGHRCVHCEKDHFATLQIVRTAMRTHSLCGTTYPHWAPFDLVKVTDLARSIPYVRGPHYLGLCVSSHLRDAIRLGRGKAWIVRQTAIAHAMFEGPVDPSLYDILCKWLLETYNAGPVPSDWPL